MSINLKEYHISTTKELLAQKDRVRNLVAHHGEDGKYKEAILKSILRKMLPERYLVATGFVVQQNENRGQHSHSSQIDIIIYDRDYPVLFKEEDFVIVTADAVKAIIEVKSNASNQSISKVVKKANDNGKFIYSAKDSIEKEKLFFNGVFSFEHSNIRTIANNATNIKQEVTDHEFKKYMVNHFCLDHDYFVKYWNEQDKYELYKLENLSFPFFISNLLNYLTNKTIEDNNFIWFVTDKSIVSQCQF